MGTFHINVAGVHHYSVRIPDKAVFNHLGDELEGLAIQSRRLILISPVVIIERREEILRHEAEHCWEFHVPVPNSDEERAQLSATIGQSLRQDIDRQGGIETLLEMKPEAISLPYRPPPARNIAGPGAVLVHDRMECHGCGSLTMCGSITNGEAEFHEGLKQYQVRRWFQCDVCNALTVWWEIATTDGRPTGSLVAVPAPRIFRGPEASNWIRDNIECAVTTL